MYHPTKEETKKSNYIFTKTIYFDLIVFFAKRKKWDIVERLKTDWEEINKLYD